IAALTVLIILICLGIIVYSNHHFNPDHRYHVGIVLPMQHAALDDIVAGFKESLEANFNGPIKIEVQNAMGDINLQRSAINKFINDKVSLLVPVATSTTQMALSLAPKDMKLLFLAANIPPDSAIAEANPNLMGVVDEIPLSLQFDFLRKSLPSIEKFT